MAVEIKIVMTKEGVPKNFIFESGEVKAEGLAQVNQIVKLSFPKDDPNDNTEDFTINLGTKKELNFSWILYNQTTDRSEGTAIAPVQTYEEMLNYLEDVITFPGVGLIEYQITITDKFRSRTAIYTYEDSNIDVDSKLHPTGNMKFKWQRQVV